MIKTKVSKTAFVKLRGGLYLINYETREVKTIVKYKNNL